MAMEPQARLVGEDETRCECDGHKEDSRGKETTLLRATRKKWKGSEGGLLF